MDQSVETGEMDSTGGRPEEPKKTIFEPRPGPWLGDGPGKMRRNDVPEGSPRAKALASGLDRARGRLIDADNKS